MKIMVPQVPWTVIILTVLTLTGPLGNARCPVFEPFCGVVRWLRCLTSHPQHSGSIPWHCVLHMGHPRQCSNPVCAYSTLCLALTPTLVLPKVEA